MANLPIRPTAVLNVPNSEYSFDITIDGQSLPTALYTIALSPVALPPVDLTLVDNQGQFLDQARIIVRPGSLLVTATKGTQASIRRLIPNQNSIVIDTSLAGGSKQVGVSFPLLNIPLSTGTNPDFTAVGSEIHYTNLLGFDGLNIDIGAGQIRYANNSGDPAFYLIFPTIKVSYRNSLLQVFTFNGGNELAVPLNGTPN